MGSYLVCIEGKNKGGVGEGFTGSQGHRFMGSRGHGITGSQVLGGRMLDAR